MAVTSRKYPFSVLMLKTSRTSILLLKPDLRCVNITAGDNEKARGEGEDLHGVLSASCLHKCLLLGLYFSIRGVD